MLAEIRMEELKESRTVLGPLRSKEKRSRVRAGLLYSSKVTVVHAFL